MMVLHKLLQVIPRFDMQYLGDCVNSVQMKGGHTEITFGTDVKAADIADAKVSGLVAWIKPEDWKAAIKELDDRKPGANGECTLTEFNKSDYVTHHGDWVQACRIAMQSATDEDGRIYWRRQLATLDRLAKDYAHE